MCQLQKLFITNKQSAQKCNTGCWRSSRHTWFVCLCAVVQAELRRWMWSCSRAREAWTPLCSTPKPSPNTWRTWSATWRRELPWVSGGASVFGLFLEKSNYWLTGNVLMFTIDVYYCGVCLSRWGTCSSYGQNHNMFNPLQIKNLMGYVRKYKHNTSSGHFEFIYFKCIYRYRESSFSCTWSKTLRTLFVIFFFNRDGVLQRPPEIVPFLQTQHNACKSPFLFDHFISEYISSVLSETIKHYSFYSFSVLYIKPP